ncbi:neuroglian-like [Mytilus edulis]|uniref:neuroglian-like n=1 Tax=Mytilus edulis TaxID=6550 RepID=UPI0039F00969
MLILPFGTLANMFWNFLYYMCMCRLSASEGSIVQNCSENSRFDEKCQSNQTLEVNITSEIESPPRIITYPPRYMYYSVGDQMELPCSADGFPKPIFEWTKNGVMFNISEYNDRMVTMYASGTILIKYTRSVDDAIYQCSAINEFGTSMSDFVNLKQAKLKQFRKRKDKKIFVKFGYSLRLPCHAPHSIPTAKLEWGLKDAITGLVYSINYTRVISTDFLGNLFIINVDENDYHGGKSYICIATNPITNERVLSYGTVVQPSRSCDNFSCETGRKHVPLHFMWFSGSSVVGLQGRRLILKCIFGGNPIPKITWQFRNEDKHSFGWEYLHEGQVHIIPKLHIDDHVGTYKCSAENSVDLNLEKVINVDIKSEPHWSMERKPESITANNGESVTFYCNATGLPMLDIEWFINGETFKVSRHPAVKLRKIRIPYPNKAVISNVNVMDRMVLQCNVSNTYGYVFSDFYLNVLHTDNSRNLSRNEVQEFAERYVLVVSSVFGLSVLLSITFVCIFTYFRKQTMSKSGNYQFQESTYSNDDVHVQTNEIDVNSRPVSLYTRIDESVMIPDYFEIVQMRRYTRTSDQSSEQSSEDHYSIPEFENPYTQIKAVSDNHLYAIPTIEITEHTFSLSALNAEPRDHKEDTSQLLDTQWTAVTSTIRKCTDWCEQYTDRKSIQMQHNNRNSVEYNRNACVLDETKTLEGGTHFRNDRVFNRLFVEKFRSDVFLSTPHLDENNKNIKGQGTKNERKSS